MATNPVVFRLFRLVKRACRIALLRACGRRGVMRESCQPDSREPMFQFALPRPLFAFTYHTPAFAPLFKLPRPSHEAIKARVTPNPHVYRVKGATAPSRLRDSPLLSRCATATNAGEPGADDPVRVAKAGVREHAPHASA